METLKDTLSLVNEWLKFAEAKNGVLVTASGVALWAIVRLFVTADMNCYFVLYLSSLCLFFLISFILALMSFLPVLNYSFIIPNKENTANQNLLYFGYLSTLSKRELLERHRLATGAKETDAQEIYGMYAEQIIINSRIALRKYAMFELSVALLICGALTPLIAVPLLYLSKSRRKKVDGI